jgi:hypothetical protein
MRIISTATSMTLTLHPVLAEYSLDLRLLIEVFKMFSHRRQPGAKLIIRVKRVTADVLLAVPGGRERMESELGV